MSPLGYSKNTTLSSVTSTLRLAPCFFPSIRIVTFSPDCCFHMDPCVIGVAISPARPGPVSGDSVFSLGLYKAAGMSLWPL